LVRSKLSNLFVRPDGKDGSAKKMVVDSETDPESRTVLNTVASKTGEEKSM
jgi:hypothetical protein